MGGARGEGGHDRRRVAARAALAAVWTAVGLVFACLQLGLSAKREPETIGVSPCAVVVVGSAGPGNRRRGPRPAVFGEPNRQTCDRAPGHWRGLRSRLWSISCRSSAA